MTNLIIKSNIKEVLPKDIRLSKEVAEALNQKVQELIKKGIERAKQNKRTTVMKQDI